MKKLFFAGAIALSLVALAATPDQSKKEKSNCVAGTELAFQDTIPGKKKDTVPKPIPDSLKVLKP